MPQLQKAKHLIGRSLVLRNATVADAGFILSLRTDRSKSKYLSYTPPEIEKQIKWLENYATKSDQAYFIIEDKFGGEIGVVRLYDQRGDSFCWGSWILKNNAPQSAAIESALIIYAYAISHLGFNQAHFDVRKDNKKVWQFHERFGAMRIGETADDYLYQIGLKDITASLRRYKKFLPGPIVVVNYDES
ncbi:GNAT family N-acetyltransferase [Methylococcus sp. ANG]|uniref:GNAT family N-acetyltransferase n=1 Tax=unclassified Methylococcus TaxID=2618889 RepID=UPI001C52CEE1|nr:GNAT family N-acetyltransferase [Methylococcus sp. Mc7]QXP83541.1 GNAT family N-acetyltransferase [Methylococcus sp. Mc7]